MLVRLPQSRTAAGCRARQTSLCSHIPRSSSSRRRCNPSPNRRRTDSRQTRSRPQSVDRRERRNPLAWQPGTATRRDSAIFSRCFAESSGKPYAQSGEVRCAVEASMIFTSGFSHRETDSRAAASGRHRKTMSASLMHFLRATGSLRSSSGREVTETSSLDPSRS